MSAVVSPSADSRICRSCQQSKANRPRGLCWTCYYSPGSKDKFPSTSKYARRGIADTTGGFQLGVPTTARPGTPEKLAVMEARAKAKQAIFHPHDAK